jgi:hypothetical protein
VSQHQQRQALSGAGIMGRTRGGVNAVLPIALRGSYDASVHSEFRLDLVTLAAMPGHSQNQYGSPVRTSNRTAPCAGYAAPGDLAALGSEAC